MNKDFLEKQLKLALKRLESLSEDEGKRAVSIVAEYIESLLNPDNFTNDQKEDLRKLALEFGYTEDTEFDKWSPTLPPAE